MAIIYKLIESILDNIFPIGCVLCGKYGELLCTNCKTGFKKNLPECFYCRKLSNGFISHNKCINESEQSINRNKESVNMYFKKVKISYEYDDNAGEIMSNYKYEGIRNLSIDLAEIIQKDFNEFLTKLSNDYSRIVICTVPLSKQRLNLRGYNQCDLILNLLFERSLLRDNKCKFNFMPDLILRRSDNVNQAHLSKNMRMQNMRGIFELNEFYREAFVKCNLGNANSSTNRVAVIIFDDVITTGSTLNEMLHAFESKRHHFKLRSFDFFGFAIFRGKKVIDISQASKDI